MKNNFFTKVILIINVIFWLFIAIYYSFIKFADKPDYLILKILLFGEPTLFLVSLWGVVKKSKLIYLASILFVIGNEVLSITDQVGSWDVISLILNILALIGLISIWKEIVVKN